MTDDVALADGLDALADQLTSGSGPVLLLADDVQLHRSALDELTVDPRGSTAVLVSARREHDARGLDAAPVRRRGGQVVSAGSPAHRVTGADAVFVGALRVGATERAAAAAAAASAAGTARRLGWAGDPVDLLLVALVRSGLAVSAVPLDPWPWRRGLPAADRAGFAADLDRTTDADVHRTRLARATKADDGLVATFLSRPLARLLTPVALRLGLTPNAVTSASLVVGLGAAALFAVGTRWSLPAGALLLQVSLVVDCVDGDVARYTRRFSGTGAWLDASTDRLKEFACYLGLAWAAGGDDSQTAWVLAAAMVTLQTSRHSIDYTFTAVKEDRDAGPAALRLDEPDDGSAVADSASARAVAASERSNRRPAVRWVKKAVHLGIGERWLLISVLAALGHPRGALAALLVAGVVSLAYTSSGRVLRTRSWPRTSRRPPSARETAVVTAQGDLAPVVPPPVAGRLLVARPDRFLWVRPALVRLLEYAVVTALVVAGGGAPALVASTVLLVVVASHHYDDLYRVLNRLEPPARWSSWLGLGAPGRVVAVLLLTAAGGSLHTGGLWVLAGLLGILYLVVEPVRVLREVRTGG